MKRVFSRVAVCVFSPFAVFGFEQPKQKKTHTFSVFSLGILNTPDNNDTGYIVEVDLEFPRHLHDKFKEYPHCPESLTPAIEWFSDFSKTVGVEKWDYQEW